MFGFSIENSENAWAIAHMDGELFRQFSARALIDTAKAPHGIRYRCNKGEAHIRMSLHNAELFNLSAKDIGEMFEAGHKWLAGEMDRLIDMAKAADAITTAWKVKLGAPVAPIFDDGQAITTAMFETGGTSIIGIAGDQVFPGDILTIESHPSGLVFRKVPPATPITKTGGTPCTQPNTLLGRHGYPEINLESFLKP